jgi:D-alanyl-D-alanine-carboxypeptidase/D-alanyl-D-alanine-endopeptidase
VFEIGSITKTFTATLLADAVIHGSVTLDEPLSNLLPGYAVPSKNGKPITLVEVATQFSGLPRLPTNFKPANPADPYVDYGPAELKAFLSNYTLPRDPGETYEYSNLAFGILGFALAEHAHKSYANLLRDKILRPLGMNMSDVATTPTLAVHVAPGHDDSGVIVPEWNFSPVDAGAGALRSTGKDMLKYLMANMDTARGPLASSMKLAHEPRRSLDEKTRIGLAWMTSNHIVQHTGATAGYFSFLGFRDDGSRGVVVLTNIASSTEELGMAALDDAAVIAKTQTRKAISLGDDALEDYVGVYKLGDQMTVTASHFGDRLFTQATGQGVLPLYPSARDEFFAKVDDISVSFQRDANSHVDGFVLHQHGNVTAPRLSGAEAAKFAKAETIDVPTLRAYLGRYEMEPGTILEVSLKGDQLYVALTGQPAFPIYARSKDKFFYTVVDAQVDFQRDDTGNILEVVLRQGGQDHRGQKIAP